MHEVTNVVGEAQHDLWGTIPPGGDVLGHEALVSGSFGRWRLPTRRCVSTGQTKVADFELAIGIDEQVTRLKVTVEHVGRVYVL